MRQGARRRRGADVPPSGPAAARTAAARSTRRPLRRDLDFDGARGVGPIRRAALDAEHVVRLALAEDSGHDLVGVVPGRRPSGRPCAPGAPPDSADRSMNSLVSVCCCSRRTAGPLLDRAIEATRRRRPRLRSGVDEALRIDGVHRQIGAIHCREHAPPGVLERDLAADVRARRALTGLDCQIISLPMKKRTFRRRGVFCTASATRVIVSSTHNPHRQRPSLSGSEREHSHDLLPPPARCPCWDRRVDGAQQARAIGGQVLDGAVARGDDGREIVRPERLDGGGGNLPRHDGRLLQRESNDPSG